MHTPHAPQALHLEQTHPLDAVTAITTAVLAVVGLVALGMEAHKLAMAAGAVGVLTGLVGQMFSRTRSERFLDVVGLSCCALAFALGAAYGGLSFNG
ncbi:MAG TPA: hypothetical protein VMZ11_07695 [Mycobacteriales bacterium]|nr:hypothetical protein [Mycobacteriales bacterium]